MSNAGTHDPGADYCGVGNFGKFRFRTAFFEFLGQEKIPDQILGRFCFAEVDNCFEFQTQGFVDGISAGGTDNFESANAGRFGISPDRSFRARRRNLDLRALSLAKFLPSRREKVFARDNLIDQAKFERFRGRIELSLQNDFTGVFFANQAR